MQSNQNSVVIRLTQKIVDARKIGPHIVANLVDYGVSPQIISNIFSYNVAKFLGIEDSTLAIGNNASFTVLEMDETKEYEVTQKDIHTDCGWSPYLGRIFKGFTPHVVIEGTTVKENGMLIEESISKLSGGAYRP